MPTPVEIVHRRRERRRSSRRAGTRRLGTPLAGLGMLAAVLLAFGLLAGGLAYAGLVRDLPSTDRLPLLLDPLNGQLLQPTRLYDRTGQVLLYTLAPDDAPRRYLPVDPQGPLARATVAALDPNFWEHPGYILDGWDQPDAHATLAQRLAADLLLWDEPATPRRALRERILAAQITARYGREQVLEWYLNSALYGRDIVGAENAARLYLGRSAAGLNLREAALLAAVAQAPALNPFDAPAAALQSADDLLVAMQVAGLLSPAEAESARLAPISLQPAVPAPASPAPAFTALAVAELERRFDPDRVARGGLTVVTTLDYDLQLQTACAVQVQVDRLSGYPPPSVAVDGSPCLAPQFLPALPSGPTLSGASAFALVLDPRTGQVLALVGETFPAGESALLPARPSGTLLTPFIYLTGFTRGLGPATLGWDLPGPGAPLNPDGAYHGPVRLRIAMANDYLGPAADVLRQMGEANAARTAGSFGLPLQAGDDWLGGETPLSPVQVAGAYAVFAAQGVAAGQPDADGHPGPSLALRVETVDGVVWWDGSAPVTQPVVTPELAYLVTHSLSDEIARWPSLGQVNPLDVDRPAAVKLGQSLDGDSAWTAGYTPQRVAVVWMGAEGGLLSPRIPAGLWSAVLRLSVRGLPADGWAMPAGVSQVQVCDPSGLLPTADCPEVVPEIFLSGTEPQQFDRLYQTLQVNRETGLLATVFTPTELVEQRVFIVVPLEARDWAVSAGLDVPPLAYDAIQVPPVDPDVHITAPELFGVLRGVVQITGTARADDLDYFRVQVGRGLNPQTWLQIGSDQDQPVEEGLLAEWDTTGLDGLYAVRLLLVHGDQRIETAVIQVTLDNTPPDLAALFPQDGARIELAGSTLMTVRVQAGDDLGLREVIAYIDDDLLGRLDAPPFAWTWTALTGAHRLRVVAVDKAGNQSEITVRFEVIR